MSTRRAAIQQVLEKAGKSAKKPSSRATGRKKSDRDQMNGLESDYALFLEADRTVQWWKFQPTKLRIAKRTWYEPDFFVMRTDNSLEIHETKGHWEDDARVKIKAAAEIFPLKFVAVRRVEGRWEFEEL